VAESFAATVKKSTFRVAAMSRFGLVCVGKGPLNGPHLGLTASRRDLGALGRNE
jgi:hypothetical protein